jgi:hypothetical protein
MYILVWFKIESLYLPEEMLGAKMISIRSFAHPTPSIRFNIFKPHVDIITLTEL